MRSLLRFITRGNRRATSCERNQRQVMQDCGRLIDEMEELLSELRIAEESSFYPQTGVNRREAALSMARAFMEEARKNPFVPMDEETVTRWFSDAMVYGYNLYLKGSAEDTKQ